MKIQNFEISKIFRTFFEISKFWIFIDFFNDFFSTKNRKMLVPKKHFDQKCSDFFRRKMFRPIFFRVPISIPNFPKIPKIILRTACDRSKYTKNAHEKKLGFFLNIAILPRLYGSNFVDPLCSWGNIDLKHRKAVT